MHPGPKRCSRLGVAPQPTAAHKLVLMLLAVHLSINTSLAVPKRWDSCQGQY